MLTSALCITFELVFKSFESMLGAAFEDSILTSILKEFIPVAEFVEGVSGKGNNGAPATDEGIP